ncbi:MAG: MarR family transcriptional regulator [Deltaproteobacteria bacterium]|nr:MAG: MarR family transcriptional regulator [Deltaproteobacteria bacterium]
MGFVSGVRQSHVDPYLLIVQNILHTQYIQDITMDRTTGIFVDGIGAGAAPSGILTELQGRIFALLYLQPNPLSLEEIAAEMQQSKSNISTTMRGLVEWQLVRIRAFFATLDAGISAFAQGESITGRSFQKVPAPPRVPPAN